ncbi:MAG TPA: hypothetical protein DHU96_04945 [Actinobacteria bacterium]|nr:hypothetical protein [Actinomycetota bacterium]
MSHSSRGPTNSETSVPLSAPIRAISASSAADSSMAPLPCDTRFTVMPSELAWASTARSTAGPSTLGISIRKWAPSGNLSGLGTGFGSAAIPRRARTSAPVTLRPALIPVGVKSAMGASAVIFPAPARPGGAAPDRRRLPPASRART